MLKKILWGIVILYSVSFVYNIVTDNVIDTGGSQTSTKAASFSKADREKLAETPNKEGLSEYIFPNNAVYKGNGLPTKSANLDADHYTILMPENIIEETPTGRKITYAGIDVETSPEQIKKLMTAVVTMFEPYLAYNGSMHSLSYNQVIDGDTGTALSKSYEEGLTSKLSFSQLGLPGIINNSDWTPINSLIGKNTKYFALAPDDRSHGSGYIFENKLDDVYIIASSLGVSTDDMDSNANTFIIVEYHINNRFFYEIYLNALRQCGIDMYPTDTVSEMRVFAGNQSISIYQTGGLNSRTVQFTMCINYETN